MPRKRSKVPWLEIRDEVYYVFWYEGGGRDKRLSLRTTDSVEAQQRYAAFLQQGHAVFAPGPSGPTVSQILDAYASEHVDKRCAAPIRQRSAIKALKPWFGNTPLRDINIPACRAYVEHRRSEQLSDATIRRELVTLRAAAGHAFRWERIDKMPKIELPAEPQRDAHWFTKAELSRLLVAANLDLRDLITVLYYTAARRESVVQMTKSQVDLRNSRINLRHPGETAAQRNSKKRRPIVPLDPALRPTIERLMMQPGEQIFPQCGDWYYYCFKRLLARLSLDGTLHSLRHSRATHLLQAGVSIYDVACLLGDTVETVQRVYAHACPDHVGEAIRRVS